VSAREEVLTRIRTALGSGPRGVRVPRDYRDATGARGDVEQLVDRLEDYRATVVSTTLAYLPASLRQILDGADAVLIPDGLPAAWLAALPESTSLVNDTGLSPYELERVTAVITGCTLAIAETGTLILDHGAGQGRRALSLVPDRHVVVVFEEQVVAGISDAVAVLEPTRPMTWISGPSATSDIELQRVEGVHGPRTVQVLLVRSAAVNAGHQP
jgi:L-lactate dehydrogenase complex protein LldG